LLEALFLQPSSSHDRDRIKLTQNNELTLLDRTASSIEAMIRLRVLKRDRMYILRTSTLTLWYNQQIHFDKCDMIFARRCMQCRKRQERYNELGTKQGIVTKAPIYRTPGLRSVESTRVAKRNNHRPRPESTGVYSIIRGTRKEKERSWDHSASQPTNLEPTPQTKSPRFQILPHLS